MGFFRRKSTPRITRDQALDACPVRNPQLDTTRTDDGIVSLKLPRRDVWWVRWFGPILRVPEYRELALDRVGSRVWELCDGSHTVRELVAIFAEEHKLSRKETEISMVTYLKQLTQRGLIMLVVQQKSNGAHPHQGQES